MTDSTHGVPPEIAEKLRAQGRREVLREITAMAHPLYWQGDDDYGTSVCSFCGGEDDHQPNCLWLRAEAAKASAEPKGGDT